MPVSGSWGIKVPKKYAPFRSQTGSMKQFLITEEKWLLGKMDGSWNPA